MKSLIDKIWDNGRKTKDSRRFRGKISEDTDFIDAKHFNNKDRDDYGGCIKSQVLRKILRSRVGEKWTDIYSDLINSKMTDYQRQQLRETLEWIVVKPDTNGEIDSRHYRDDFIVIDGKLTYRPYKTWKQKRKEQEKEREIPEYFSVDGRHYYFIWDTHIGYSSKGNWYEITRNPSYKNTDSIGRLLCHYNIDCGNSAAMRSYSGSDNLNVFKRRLLGEKEIQEVLERYYRQNPPKND